MKNKRVSIGFLLLFMLMVFSISACSHKKNTKSNNSETSEPNKENSQSNNDTIDPSLQELLTECEDHNASCAVAYLGYLEEGTKESVRDFVNQSKYAQIYSFLSDISEDQIVDASGCEIYCIVPYSSTATVTVNRVSLGDDGTEVIGDSIYEGEGDPFLLISNVSDIMPNSLITISDQSTKLEYSPFLSLKDGTLGTPSEVPYVYDFSDYSK